MNIESDPDRLFWHRKMEEQFAARKAQHEFEQAAKEFLSPLSLGEVLRREHAGGVASGIPKDPDRDRYGREQVCMTCGVECRACMCQVETSRMPVINSVKFE